MAIGAIIGAGLQLAPIIMDLIGKGGKKDSSGQTASQGGQSAGSVAAPLVMGGIQTIQGIIKKRKGESLEPMAEDPMVRNELSRIQRQAQALRSGTDSSRVSQQIAKLNQQSMLNAAKVGGIQGVSAMGRVNASTTQALVNLSKQGRQAALGQDKLASAIIKRMEARKFDLQRQKQNRILAEAAQLKKSGMENVLAAAASAGSLDTEVNDDLLNQTTASTSGNTSDPN